MQHLRKGGLLFAIILRAHDEATSCQRCKNTAFLIHWLLFSNMHNHKNKTIAAFGAALLGAFGAHRFYLYGKKDVAGWAHAASVPMALAAAISLPAHPVFFLCLPIIISALLGSIEALIIGLTPDEKWDATHNTLSGESSKSGWPLAVLLVLTFGAGAIGLIAVIARSFDLLFTGGAYG